MRAGWQGQVDETQENLNSECNKIKMQWVWTATAAGITFLVSLAVLMDLLMAQMVVFQKNHFFSNKFMTKLKRPLSTSLCFPIDLF